MSKNICTHSTLPLLMTRRFIIALVFVLACGLGTLMGWLFFAPTQSVDHTSGVANISQEDQWKIDTWSLMKFYFERHEAFVRFFDTGEVGPLTEIYSAEAHKFTSVNEVSLAKICPAQVDYYANSAYIFWASRNQYLHSRSSDGGEFLTILAGSYAGAKAALHRGKAFDAVIDSRVIVGGKPIRLDVSAGLMSKHMERKGAESLTDSSNGHFIAYGYNTGDVDEDGTDDFILGDEIYLSGRLNNKEISGGLGVGRNSVFLKSGRSTVIATLTAQSVQLRSFDKARNELRVIEKISIANIENQIDKTGPFSLFPLPDINHDGQEDFAVKLNDAIALFLSPYSSTDKLQTITLTGVEKGFLLIGGFADYDGDGVMDLWVTQPQRLGPGPDNRFGWASLILSKEIQRTNTSPISISDIAKFTLTGSAQFSDYDGIGTSVSLRSGDTNGDGLPDFSISGHRHLNEAGAMFLVSGKDIMRSRTMNVTDERIAKIRGEAMTQLAAPYFHMDAFDWDRDGYADIVVNADNDGCSGASAGAIHVASGRGIWDRFGQIKRKTDGKPTER